MDEDIKAFLADSYENLDRIEQGLVSLEQNPTDGELLADIYRCLHTIKGNCGFVAFTKLEAIAHSGENLLSSLRNGELLLNGEIATTLLELVDAIQEICDRIETTEQEGDADYSILIHKLNCLQENLPSISSHPEKGKESETLPLSTDLNCLSDRTESWDLTNVEQDSRGEDISRSMLPLDRDETGNQPESTKSLSSIRVDINLLDRLMNLIGELVLVRNQILQLSTTQEDATFAMTSQQLNRLTTELQEGVMKTRMQPIDLIWNRFPRVVRDAALASGKQVRLKMEGEETELDKTILEAIKDPLIHIIRNCIDHGIELPEVRRQIGKPESGYLHLQAFHESGSVNIEIADDGAGIDPEQIKQRAIALGLIDPEESHRLTPPEALNLIFLPGFSTAKTVTRLSGRGVGMDIVKTHIEKVGGTVEIQSQLGQGTQIKLKIPLTLAIIPALIVTSGGDRYAIPQMSIVELVRLEGEQAHYSIERVHNAPVYRLRGKLLPLVSLNQELGLESAAFNLQPLNSHEAVNILVVQTKVGSPFGLVVDAINDTQEIVVKSLGQLLRNTPCFAGATILGDGQVALILDVSRLAQRAGVLSEAQLKARLEQETIPQQPTDDRQVFLLFELLNSRMAIPLTRVLRLEEIPRDAIEKVGTLTVVQHRDRILPLIDLVSLFNPSSIGARRSRRAIARRHQTAETSDSLPVDSEPLQAIVVSSESGITVGLVVSRILDITVEALGIRGAANRPGVQAIATLQGKVTEILDLEDLIQRHGIGDRDEIGNRSFINRRDPSLSL